MRYLMITSFQQDISYDKIGFFAKKNNGPENRNSTVPKWKQAGFPASFELLPFWTMFKFLRVAIGAGTLFFPKMGGAQFPDSHFFVNIIFPTVSCPKKCSIFSPMAYKNLKKMLVTPTYFRHWVCVSPWSNWQGICTQIFIGDVARNGW